MKRTIILLFAAIISTVMMAEKHEIVFEVASNIAQPITVITGSGHFTVYNYLKIDRWTRVDQAFDANGNQVVVPLSHSTTKGSGNNRVKTTTYRFKTLYNTSSSSSSTSSSKPKYGSKERLSKEERKERREERTRASIEANWFSLGKAIDLELPSGNIWAGYNLGAESSLDAGEFYTWGGVSPLSEIGSSASNYFDLDNKIFSLNGRTRLTAEYDAAFQEWGENWQIPTKADFMELLEYCDWKYGKINGVKGFQATSPNGKKLFFPVVGSCLDGYWDNELTGYWASDIYDDGGVTKGGMMACIMWEGMEDNVYSAYQRYGFMQIRPVWKDTPVESMNTQAKVDYSNYTGYVEDYILPNGDIYTGELKNGQFHGKGKVFFTRNDEKSIYEGEFINGWFRKGSKIKYTQDGTFKSKFVGEWEEGEEANLVNGSYYEWYDPNFTVKSYISYDKEGAFNTYDGTFSSGQIYIELKNGLKYEGNVHGYLSGQGTLTLPDGSKYVGEFKDGVITGNGRYYGSSGKVITREQWDKSYLQEYKDAMRGIW